MEIEVVLEFVIVVCGKGRLHVDALLIFLNYS